MAAALPLSSRVAIITGASCEISHAIATHLASLGASLVLGYSSHSVATDQLASQLNSSHQTPCAVAVLADVSDAEAVKSLFDAAESAFGGRAAHILIVCDSVLDNKYPTLAATTDEDWDRTFAVNTRGAFLCCREAANRLVRGGGGRIVCITSSTVASLRPRYVAYVASKAAVEAMVKVLAKELRGTGITANCVAPGLVVTEMFFAGSIDELVKETVGECPLGPLGEVKDIAPMVGFLCTDVDESVNGQVVRVNGGYF